MDRVCKHCSTALQPDEHMPPMTIWGNTLPACEVWACECGRDYEYIECEPRDQQALQGGEAE